MSSLDAQLKSIQDKLSEFIKRQSRLEKENAALKEELEKIASKETDLQNKLATLELQVELSKAASSTLDEKEKKNLEKKINGYIKEIDQCIAFLKQ